MSWSKMMSLLLVGAICSLYSSLSFSDSLPKVFSPAVIYVSAESAAITWERIKAENIEDGYTIEYGKNWKNSKVIHVSRSSNTAIIPNLHPDTLYKIRMRVPDVKNGGSLPGASVRFRTKSLVAASVGTPRKVTVEPLSSYKLLVTWDLPYRIRASDVVHYSLVFAPVYSPYLRKTSLILPGHYKSFTLSYLRPNTIYKVKIAALLKSRRSPYSFWVIAETVNQPRLDTAMNRPTERPYHVPTEEPSVAVTSDKELRHTTGQKTSSPPPPPPPPLPTTTPKQYVEETTERTMIQQGKQPTEQLRNKKTQQTEERATEERATEGSKSHTKRPTTQQILLRPTTPSRTPSTFSTITISPKLVAVTGAFPTTTTKDTCESLEPSICSDIGYHTTKMTSKGSQSEMKELVESMWNHLTPLCEGQAKLKQFLCAASFPYCSKNLGGPFVPCRSMCISTKRNCNMDTDGDWPLELDCSNFPAVGESEICIAYGHERPATTTKKINLPIIQWTQIPPSNVPKTENQTITTMATVSILSAPLATKEPNTLPSPHCEPLFLKACDGVGYQYVQFPNYFNQKHQNDAGVKISKYWPLIEATCSPLLKLFLCSLYTPMCTIDSRSREALTRNIMPCRSVCQQVTKDCSFLMKIYGFAWPDGIKCDDFPDVSDDTCISPKNLKYIRQGKGNVMETSPTSAKEVQVTINRSSTKAILISSPRGISVVQEASKNESTSGFKTMHISAFNRVKKPTSKTPTQKTGSNIKVNQNREVEDSTNAVAQRNEERLTSTDNPMINSSLSTLVTFPPPSGCETLYLRICKGVGYDFTQFPNYFNHTHQNDAGRALYRFWNLVEMKCSPKLQLFLCSLYAPMCTKRPSCAKRMIRGVTHSILPCRSLCRRVKRECRDEMKLFGVNWPEGIQCTNFPVDGDQICLHGSARDADIKVALKFGQANTLKFSPKKPLTPLPGTIKCLPLPANHTCQNHYKMASLSNASDSLDNLNKFIKGLLSTIKDNTTKKCLRNVEMLLCSLYSPRCSDDASVFGPCRSQCKTTVRRCGKGLLKKVHIDISGLKDCRRFPLSKCTGNKRRLKTKIKSIKHL